MLHVFRSWTGQKLKEGLYNEKEIFSDADGIRDDVGPCSLRRRLSDAATEGDAASGDLPTVGVLIYKYDDTYISTVRNSLQAALEGKANVEMQDGKGDQATQNDQLDVMISKGVDVLCVNMVDAKAASGVVEKASAAGIPTIFFNREPDTEVIKSYDKACFIGTKRY